ncbi:unnamed protein product [Sympodiomycopsis kandeliae]
MTSTSSPSTTHDPHADQDATRSTEGDTEYFPPASLDRLDPEAILAHDADPDTLFSAESDSEYGSRRSSYANIHDTVKIKSKTNSNSMAQNPEKSDCNTSEHPIPSPVPSHVDDNNPTATTMTPTQSTYDISAIQVPPTPTNTTTAKSNDPASDASSPSSSSPSSSAEEVKALKAQLEDLTNQVTGLNGKLVNSFMRISDLEDDLSDAKDRVMSGSTRVAELEKERQEHLAALNTGLLVEKAHVSTEMQRMMDRVIEETKQRGQAESDKAKIESELDELSASLFNEANRMVAVEKLARARAEEKSKSTEERLQDTEGIMLEQQKVLADLQKQLDAYKAGEGDETINAASHGTEASSNVQDSPSQAVASRSDPRKMMSRRPSTMPNGAIDPKMDQRLVMLDIVPYQELRAFLNHLRKLRKQLAPFYNYPYDPKRGAAVHRQTASVDTPGVGTPQAPGSPALGTTLNASASVTSYGITTDHNGQFQSNPFMIAGVSRHKDYPTLPSNCEQLVHLPSQSSLPFIKRAQEEDTDPCLRLDFAPGLNWLSRRTANTAILEGNLVIEPVFAGGVVENQDAIRAEYAHLPPAACAMCGVLVVNVPLPGGDDAAGKASAGPDLRSVTSWASSFTSATGSAANSIREAAGGTPNTPASASTASDTSEKAPPLKSNRSGLFSSFASLRNMTSSPKPTKESTPVTPVLERSPSVDGPSVPSDSPHMSGKTTISQPATPTSASHKVPWPTNGPLPVPTHIFRLSETATTRYLLCPHHCLARLRAACAFWGYLRNIERAVVLEGKLAWDDEQQQQQQQQQQSLQRNATIKPSVKQPESAASSIVEGQEPSATEDKATDAASAAQVVEQPENTTATEVDKPVESTEEPSQDTDAEQKDTDTNATEEKVTEAESPPSDKDASASDAGNTDRTRKSSITSSVYSTTDEGFQDAHSDAEPNDSAPYGSPSEQEVQPATDTERSLPEPPSEEPESVSTPMVEKSESSATSSATVPPVPPRRQRPVPALPTSATSPPTLPPRLPPTKTRLNFNGHNENETWEEKVYLEVMKLKKDMWEARVGFVADD